LGFGGVLKEIDKLGTGHQYPIFTESEMSCILRGLKKKNSGEPCSPPRQRVHQLSTSYGSKSYKDIRKKER